MRLPARKLPLLVCIIGAGLGGCGHDARSGAAGAPEPAGQAEGPEAVAAATVAEFLSTDAADVSVVSIEARDFPDSSLGCPQPGMSYLQVITPGYRVLVEADGRRFDVRVSGQRGRICHRRKPRRDSDDGPRVPDLVGEARADLASRLGLEADAISVGRISVWRPGQSLPGCAVNCAAGARICGYVIRLQAHQRHFDYFGSTDGVTACPPILDS